jgi:hypothetical protein
MESAIEDSMYDPWRFRTIVLLIVLFGVLAVSAVLRHRFPLTFGAVLCLLPCLSRAQAAKRGVMPYWKLRPLEWSCLVAGVLWVFVSPLLA